MGTCCDSQFLFYTWGSGASEGWALACHQFSFKFSAFFSDILAKKVFKQGLTQGISGLKWEGGHRSSTMANNDFAKIPEALHEIENLVHRGVGPLWSRPKGNPDRYCNDPPMLRALWNNSGSFYCPRGVCFCSFSCTFSGKYGQIDNRAPHLWWLPPPLHWIHHFSKVRRV